MGTGDSICVKESKLTGLKAFVETLAKETVAVPVNALMRCAEERDTLRQGLVLTRPTLI